MENDFKEESSRELEGDLMSIKFIEKNDVDNLAEFFGKIDKDENTKNFFHPHPLDRKNAQKICNKEGIEKDLYFIKMLNDKIAGYAMLRGWDEGYDIPSFGICVDPEFQSQGIGNSLTEYAISVCKNKGVEKIMLKVYKENRIAKSLYEKFGFEFTGETKDGEQLVGYLKL